MCRCKNNPRSINPNTGKLYKSCDKCRERGRKYQENNPEKHREAQRKYYENNREKLLESTRKYRENNPFKLWIFSSKRTDIKYNQYDPDNFITEEYCQQIADECKDICYYCECELNWKIGVGHTRPPNRATIERLDNSIGHVIGNCVVACNSCNVKKLSNKK